MAKVNKNKKEDDLADLVNAATPLINAITPLVEKVQLNNRPVLKRAQWMNFVIMFSLVILICFLAYTKIIDGSAATGLLGAIIGYVFGNIYSTRDKK